MKKRSFSFLILLYFFCTSAFAETLKLIFAGDIMSHQPQTKAAEIRSGVYDFSPSFRYIKPLLESADLAIGNLELTLFKKPPYTGYPRFRAPAELAAGIKEAGFDVLVTANNHSNDGDGAGVRSTIEAIQEQGLLQTGTFVDLKSREKTYPLFLEKKGFKIALLNYTYGTNGIPDQKPTHVNVIDPEVIQQDIQQAKKQNPDAIIVFLHWGLEYQLIENADQRALAEQLYSWGVDLVVGSHPHVVQPIRQESWKGEDGQVGLRWVAYSLGNFISNQKDPNTDGGILWEVDFERDAQKGRLVPVSQRYHIFWRYIGRSKGKVDYVLLPVDRPETWKDLTLDKAALQSLKKFTDATRKRLEVGGVKQ